MSLYSTTILSDAPVAYWRLGERGGAGSALDSSGNAHAATYSGAMTLGMAGAIAGDNDAAMQLSGGYVSCGSGGAFSFVSGDFSLEAWVFPTDTAGFSAILNRGDGASNAASQYELINSLADGHFTFDVFQGAARNTVTAPSTHATGQWYHVVGTRAASSGVNTLYVNGVAVATQTYPGALNAVSPNLALGAAGSGAIPLSGLLDEAAIYARALSAARVRAHYLAALTHGACAPLIGPSVIIRRSR